MYLFFSGFLLTLFYISAKLAIYSLLKTHIGIYDSYLMDQLFFPFLFLGLYLFSFLKKKTLLSLKEVILLIFWVLLAFFTLGDLLPRFFINDDLFVMILVLNDPKSINTMYAGHLFYYYYHYMPFALVYRFFEYQSYYFNFLAVFSMGISAACLYKLLRYLNKLLEIRYRLFAFLIVVFYLTIPNIVGEFRYLEHGTAIGYIATATILSVYFYLKFLNEKPRSGLYFILSYILMLSMLKTSLTRVGFLPVILIIAELFYFPKQKKERMLSFLRMGLVFLAFYIIGKPYFFVSPQAGALYSINLSRFVNYDRLYLFVASPVAYLIPSQFFPLIFDFILNLGGYSGPIRGFVLNNLTFCAGLLLIFSTGVSLLILHFRKVNVKLLIIFWLSSIVCLLFYALAGGGI